MKTSKKYWQMKSLTGVILVCIFLTACGGETQEAERKSNVQENETVSTTTIEQTAEQTQETTQEAEEFVQTDTILENLKGNREPQTILQELSELPLSIEELRAYPVYVLSTQFEECSGVELLDEFYEQSTQGNPAQLLMANYLYNEKWILSYIVLNLTEVHIICLGVMWMPDCRGRLYGNVFSFPEYYRKERYRTGHGTHHDRIYQSGRCFR